jgi:DNA-binding CsgD family transcriptional regulator
MTPREVTPEYAARLCDELTDLERRTLVLVLQGYSSKEIAKMAGRALKTIEGTRARFMEKLGAINASHCAVIATKAGLV